MQESIKAFKNKFSTKYSLYQSSIITLCTISAIMAFFFTSRLWMPVAGSIKDVPVGTVQNFGQTDLTLKSVRLNSKEGFILVNIGFKDRNVDKVLEMKYGAFNSADQSIAAERLYEGADFLIIKVPKAKQKKGVNLGIQVFEKVIGNEEEMNPPVLFFGIITSQYQGDENLKGSYSDAEYELMNMLDDKDLLQLQLNEIGSGIKYNEGVIEAAEDKISVLEKNKKFQTDEELEESNLQIKDLKKSIQSTMDKIQELESDGYKVSSSIKDKESKIQEFKKANSID